MKGESAKNFATQGPNYYLASHMMWNPEIDADKVMDRFYKAFGPAADDIRRERLSFISREAFSKLPGIYSWQNLPERHAS